MATNDRLHLTADQALLEHVMWEVVMQVQDAGFVLKGGGALVLVYGSIRHTTDLDFDAERQTDMPLRIRRAMQLAGVEIDETTWWWPKGKKGAKNFLRYRVRFVGHQGKRRWLQVDTRYRPKPRSSDIVTVTGVRTYKPEALYEQKLAAVRDRKAARDIFDMAFLCSKYGDTLTDDQIRETKSITRDTDQLEHDFRMQLLDDRILARVPNAKHTVLEFRGAANQQIQRRGMEDPQQSVPISLAMHNEIIALRRLIHGEEIVKSQTT